MMKGAVYFIAIFSPAIFATKCPSGCLCFEQSQNAISISCLNQALTSIPKNLDPNTQILRLDDNDFGRISGPIFEKIHILSVLSLMRCGIKNLTSESFKGLTNLKYLDLTQNRLTDLPPDLLAHMKKLTNISLRANQLTAIGHKLFEGTTSLEEIDLSFNQIVVINYRSFETLTQLRSIDLSENKLRILPVAPFKELPSLKKLVLLGNPWRCDCHLRSFAKWYRWRSLGHSPKCHWPEKQKLKKWNRMTPNQFACGPVLYQNSLQTTHLKSRLRGTAAFECSLGANPEPLVVWKFKPVGNDTLFTIKTVLGRWYEMRIVEFLDRSGWTYVLTVQNIEASDAGAYYCIASNAANTTTKRFELEVTEKTTELNGVKWFRNKMDNVPTKGFSRFLSLIALGSFMLFILLLCSGGFLLPRGKPDSILVSLTKSRNPSTSTMVTTAADVNGMIPVRRALSAPGRAPFSRRVSRSTMAVISESAEIQPLLDEEQVSPVIYNRQLRSLASLGWNGTDVGTRRAAFAARRAFSVQQVPTNIKTSSVQITSL